MNTSMTHSNQGRLPLRRHTLLIAAALGAITLLAAASLKGVTDEMGSATRSLETAAVAAHASEAVLADVLIFNSLSNLVQVTHAGDAENARSAALEKVYQHLDELRSSVDPPHRPAVEKVATDIDGFVAARHHDDAGRPSAEAMLTRSMSMIDALVGSLRKLAGAEWERQMAEAKRVHFWDDAGDWIGLVVIAGGIATIVALYSVVFRPLFQLVEAMKRFGTGDRTARADPVHGIDLAGTATTFNEMADIITGQHTRMLDYLGEVSRELRNPLEVMRMALKDVAPGRPLAAGEKAQTKVAIVAREVDRLDRLVDGFVDASRIEWQRLDLQLGKQDVRRLVGEIVRVYETFSPHHQVALSAPETPVCVSFDQHRIAQVLHSLMANAFQHTPGGGVINVDVKREGNEATVSVTDHGVGMSKEDLERMFEPFRMAAGGPAEKPHASPGALVALSVARRIAEAHGGKLVAKSKVGEGSMFQVRLPLAQEEAAAAASRASAPVSAPAPSRP
jgi:signal transduction histidine kinase